MINAASIRLVCESGAAAADDGDDDGDSKKSRRILKETAERTKDREEKGSYDEKRQSKVMKYRP